MTLRETVRIVGLILWSVPSFGDVVPLTATIHGHVSPEVGDVVLQLERTDGSERLERFISVPEDGSIHLPSGNWRVSTKSTEFWSPSKVVSSGEPLSLEFWPAATLTGRATTRTGEKLQGLSVSFDSADTDFALHGDAECSENGGRWHCVVPQGLLDLQFLSRSHASEFRWAQNICAGGGLDWGDIRFLPGPSLSGFVRTATDARERPDGAMVTATRLVSPGASDPRSYTATADERGFFQFAPVPPGEYVVTATKNGLRSEATSVVVIANRNAAIRKPLLLRAPLALYLEVSNSPDLLSEWFARIYKYEEPGRYEEVDSGALRDGKWRTSILPGRYLLRVGRSDGAIWHQEEINVEKEDVNVRVFIEGTRVKGHVTLGGQRVPFARLIFGGESGPVQQSIDADVNGEFSGSVPAAANDDDIWPISIESQDVHRLVYERGRKSSDGSVEFEISLPATRIAGRTLNEDGTPAHAIVTIESDTLGAFQQARSASDGAFDFLGLAPGTYRIFAEGPEQSSEIASVEVTEEQTSEVLLVLNGDVIVNGRVESSGSSIPMATLTALPRDSHSVFVPTARGDEAGSFRLKLPPHTRVFDVVVSAPGFPVASGRVRIQDNKRLTLYLGQIGGVLLLEIGDDGSLRHDGAEFPVRWLVAQYGGHTTGNGDTTRLTLPNFEPGEYALCGNGRCVTGTLTPGGTLDLSLFKENQ